jgi:hypothetical protein
LALYTEATEYEGSEDADSIVVKEAVEDDRVVFADRYYFNRMARMTMSRLYGDAAWSDIAEEFGEELSTGVSYVKNIVARKGDALATVGYGPTKGTSPMDGLEDVIELHAVYGFKDSIVIDLESVDSDWLDGHCDVVGFARSKAEVPAGLWLARGCVVEVSETRLVARRDERAVRTLSGPIAVYFTRSERQGPSIRWEWASNGDCPPARLESPSVERRELAIRDTEQDFAPQATHHRAPMSRGAMCPLNLRGEITNERGQQRDRIMGADLMGSPLREWTVQT